MDDMTTIHGEDCASWAQTFTGAAVDLADPDPATIAPHDIRVALSRIPRFNGHTVEPYSVAAHSVFVHDLVARLWSGNGFAAPASLLLAALLHDAHEAFMGDVISPVASLPGFAAPVKQLKRRLQAAIHTRFGLPEMLPNEWRATIKHADMVALATEKRDLMLREPRPWIALPPAAPHIHLDLATRYDHLRRFEWHLHDLSARVSAGCE